MKNFVYFLAGAVSGAAIMFYSIRKHYENLAQEEIDSVKKVYKKKYEDKQKMEEVKVVPESGKIGAAVIKNLSKEDPKVLVEAIKKMNYASKDNSTEESVEEKKEPYPISDEEFSEENQDYDKVDLAYYSDGALAEDGGDNDLVEDIAGTVGLDFASHMGEYDEDVAYIRNDRLKTDYEILRDNQTYEEVTGKPYERTEG